MNFAPVPELIEELRAGRMVVIVDDEDRENVPFPWSTQTNAAI